MSLLVTCIIHENTWWSHLRIAAPYTCSNMHYTGLSRSDFKKFLLAYCIHSRILAEVQLILHS